jgi:hypothetical protein
METAQAIPLRLAAWQRYAVYQGNLWIHLGGQHGAKSGCRQALGGLCHGGGCVSLFSALRFSAQGDSDENY